MIQSDDFLACTDNLFLPVVCIHDRWVCPPPLSLVSHSATLLVVVRDAGGGLRHEASGVLSSLRLAEGRSRAWSDYSHGTGVRTVVVVVDSMTPRGPAPCPPPPALFTRRSRGDALERVGSSLEYTYLFI